jgi:hypothetical protein
MAGGENTIPMAMVVEGEFTRQATIDAFPVLLEDIKQALAKHNGGEGIEVRLVHLFIRGAATDVVDAVAKINERDG